MQFVVAFCCLLSMRDFLLETAAHRFCLLLMFCCSLSEASVVSRENVVDVGVACCCLSYRPLLLLLLLSVSVHLG
jgi:hypothetical protein